MSIELNRNVVMDCIRAHGYQRIKEEIGRGSQGVAYIACEKATFQLGGLIKIKTDVSMKDCKLVIKVMKITPQSQQEIMRETVMYGLLRNSSIAPKLFSSWDCQNARYFALQRFTGDVTTLGRTQLAAHRARLEAALVKAGDAKEVKKAAAEQTSLVYTEAQMRVMFQLAKKLGEKYGIIHGDLKAQNMLYDEKTGQIVIADFGFAGYYPPKESDTILAQVGWPWWLTKGCKNGEFIFDSDYPGDYNMFQLAAYFGGQFVNTYVYMNNGSYAIFRINRIASTIWRRYYEECYNTPNTGLVQRFRQKSEENVHLPAYNII